MEDIFISVAAYRDPELIPTLKDCVDNASDPQRLKFTICWQYDDEPYSDEFLHELGKIQGIVGRDNKINLISLPYHDSKGACWARHKIQTKYNNEKYVLQIDSHHRFRNNWDQILIDEIKSMIENGISEKPLLTSYLPSYEPDNEPNGRLNQPWQLSFDRYLPQGPAMPVPEAMDKHWMTSGKNPQCRMFSAHFVFAPGEFYKEVLYDPDLYFHGEEISLAVRAYTHGWDLFSPCFLIMWHHYTRLGAKRHWDDIPHWEDNNLKSFERYRQLVECEDYGIDLGIYGLGTERTLDDFIRYSGLDLRNKQVHKRVLNKETPPLQYDSEDDFNNGFCRKIKYCINLYRGDVPLEDYDCWVVVFKNRAGQEVYRQDCSKEEISQIIERRQSHEEFYHIWREYEDIEDPVEWLVWPHSESQDWCNIITGQIDEK
jgi:hypothetical protein